MLQDKERIALQDMLDAARKAQAFMAGRSRQDLAEDEKLSLAVQRLLEILGEAAKKVTKETRAQASDIKWRKISGMRDKLSHAYSEVDLDIVWATVSDELPPLVVAIEALLAAAGPAEDPRG